jgi:hypothetical protein
MRRLGSLRHSSTLVSLRLQMSVSSSSTKTDAEALKALGEFPGAVMRLASKCMVNPEKSEALISEFFTLPRFYRLCLHTVGRHCIRWNVSTAIVGLSRDNRLGNPACKQVLTTFAKVLKDVFSPAGDYDRDPPAENSALAQAAGTPDWWSPLAVAGSKGAVSLLVEIIPTRLEDHSMVWQSTFYNSQLAAFQDLQGRITVQPHYPVDGQAESLSVTTWCKVIHDGRYTSTHLAMIDMSGGEHVRFHVCITDLRKYYHAPFLIDRFINEGNRNFIAGDGFYFGNEELLLLALKHGATLFISIPSARRKKRVSFLFWP